MRICLAQVKPDKGNIKGNIENHKKWIEIAVSEKADLIIFPELSLTGYEPKLAEKLASNQNDLKLNVFQVLSNQKNIIIGVGLPTKSELGVRISMVIFQPELPRQTYSKQLLHSDEIPFFVPGNEQLILTIKDKKIAPAICYESLQTEHSANAIRLGVEIYLASVAKSQTGIDKAYSHYPKIAEKFSIPVLMANCIGYCDNFFSAGQTSVWNENGELLGQLDDKNEGLLVFDTLTNEIITYQH